MIKKLFCTCILITAFSLPAFMPLNVGAQTSAATVSASSETPTAPAQKKMSDEEKDKLVLEHLNLKDKVKRCSGLEDRSVRLSCNDNIAEELGYMSTTRVKADEEKLGKIGFWEISRKARPDGVMQTYLRLESSNKIESAEGTERHVVLAIRCSTGKTEIFLDWKAPLIKGLQSTNVSKKLLTYYTISEKKYTEDWEISMDKYALFSLDPISFVRNILKQKKLTMEFMIGPSQEVVDFDITGVETGIDTIVKSCY